MSPPLSDRLLAARWVTVFAVRWGKDRIDAINRELIAYKHICSVTTPLAAKKALLAALMDLDLAWSTGGDTRGGSSWLNLLRWWSAFAPHLCTPGWLCGFGHVHLRTHGHMHPRVAAWFRARLGEWPAGGAAARQPRRF